MLKSTFLTFAAALLIATPLHSPADTSTTSETRTTTDDGQTVTNKTKEEISSEDGKIEHERTKETTRDDGMTQEKAMEKKKTTYE